MQVNAFQVDTETEDLEKIYEETTQKISDIDEVIPLIESVDEAIDKLERKAMLLNSKSGTLKKKMLRVINHL